MRDSSIKAAARKYILLRSSWIGRRLVNALFIYKSSSTNNYDLMRSSWIERRLKYARFFH
jgi:hypothetical protein